MQDFLGRNIEVGDTIVYPVRLGSSMWMNKAKVVEIRRRNTYPTLMIGMDYRTHHEKSWLMVKKEGGHRMYPVTRTDRVTVVPQWFVDLDREDIQEYYQSKEASLKKKYGETTLKSMFKKLADVADGAFTLVLAGWLYLIRVARGGPDDQA